MYKIGFDIGGTNIAAGLINDELEMIQHISVPFPMGADGEQVALLLKQIVEKLLAAEGVCSGELECIGIAVPGSIDHGGDVVINAYNLGFHDVPLRVQVQKLFNNIPVLLANDANAAALAELHKGAFRGCNTAVLLTIGTGVGGGLILSGRMFNGGNNGGVELGHMTLDYGGELCSCNQRGCIETLCSATALARSGRRAAQGGNKALLMWAGSMENVDARAVIECAKAGDAECEKLFLAYVDALASALASIVNLLDPEVIALGGGVSLAGDFLYEPLDRLVRQKSFFEYHGSIVPASMGNDAGIFGAAMLLENQGKK